MFLIRLAVRLLLGVVILLAAVVLIGSIWARSEAQKRVAAHVKAATGAQSVSVKINSFPFLYDVMFSDVPQVNVVAHQVPVGVVDLSQVTVVARKVHVDRHLLITSREVKVTSVGSATVTLLVKSNDLTKIATEAGAEVSVVGGHQLEVAWEGHVLATVDLTASPLVPNCDYALDQAPGGYSLSCTVSPVPTSLIDAISTEKV